MILSIRKPKSRLQQTATGEKPPPNLSHFEDRKWVRRFLIKMLPAPTITDCMPTVRTKFREGRRQEQGQ